MNDYIIIQTTFATIEEAKKVIKILIDKRLVSCAQISNIESYYHWKNDVAHEPEFLVTLKTKENLYQKVEQLIKDNHSYETPQIIAIPITKGSKEYLNWIKTETSGE